MASPASRSAYRNHLLKTLSEADFALVQPHLEPLDLPLRHSLEHRNKAISHIYFLEDGLGSVVAKTSRNREIEVGIIGAEGLTGLNVVMGNSIAPHDTFMQVGGTGYRLTADQLRDAMNKSATLRLFLLHFAQAFMIQTAYTALANGQAKVEERLARWLLMAHDRLSGDELPLTHEFLSLMLSVRRAGVSVALEMLEQQGLISMARAKTVIVDRQGLKALANGLYGIPEAGYLRLTGWQAKA